MIWFNLVGYGLVGLGWQYLQFNTTRIRYVKDMFLELSRESSPIPPFCLCIASMNGEQSRCLMKNWCWWCNLVNYTLVDTPFGNLDKQTMLCSMRTRKMAWLNRKANLRLHMIRMVWLTLQKHYWKHLYVHRLKHSILDK